VLRELLAHAEIDKDHWDWQTEDTTFMVKSALEFNSALMTSCDPQPLLPDLYAMFADPVYYYSEWKNTLDRWNDDIPSLRTRFSSPF